MRDPDTAPRRQPSVAIIGTGFGGLGMALELRRAGFDNFTIFEKATDIGGVWRENTYPGAGCDIPSPYYSFSFEPEPHWPRRYSGHAEIHGYLTRVVEKYGLREHIRFGTEVIAAEFDADRGRWRIETNTGETIEAEVFVPATGQLSRPAMPDIPGIDTFRGHAFHSARWDHDYDLCGRRIAVIGTGASAIQFVPRIQPIAQRLTLFQRSAPYVLPKPDGEYRRWQRALYERIPATQLVERGLFWTTGEFATLGIIGHRRIGRMFAKLALWHLRRSVPDPELRAKLTPDYEIGCKRVLFANDYFPALNRPNVRVETTGIREITPDGVCTVDGTEHEADVIVYGTGFATNDFLAPMKIVGLGGCDVNTVWTDGARAYLGMAVPGFPNMFLMYGPNTNLGSGSIIYMIERQARYIRQIVEYLAAREESYVDISGEVADRFDAEIQGRLSGSAWATCSSWYREDSGRVSANWPGLVSEYHRRTKTPDLAAYRIVPVS